MNIKKPLIFCLLVIVLVLLNLGVSRAVYINNEKTQVNVYSTNLPDNLKNLPQEHQTPSLERGLESEPKYNGFIVSFPETPILIYQKNLQAQGKTKTQIDSLLVTYKSGLVSKHNAIKQKFAKTPAKIGPEFYGILNGMTLYITEQECNQLVAQKLVEKCFKNHEVDMMLNESIPLINADDVWKLPDPNRNQNLTGKGITIAIIDTGVDSTHPDLDNGKVVQEHCYCSYGGACCPNGQNEQHGPGSAMDDYGHGTHCASIAAGTGEASNGQMKGVAPDANIEAIKVLNRYGSGSEDDVILGVEKAVQDNVSLISMSLGGSVDDCYEWVLSNVLDNAVDMGINVIVAAGNQFSYQTILAPGCAKKVITVGASCKPGQESWCPGVSEEAIALFSSRGPTNDLRIKPDIVAPGVDICAAKASLGQIGSDCYQGQGTYVYLSGTSMATPHVAGLVALMKQRYPNWTPQEIKNDLRNNAVNLIDPETNQSYDILTQGYGRIDALASILSYKPPIARLDTSGVLNGTRMIIGYIYADNFKKYRLEYGQGIQPTNWTLLVEREVISAGGVLYKWNTTQVKDGLYTLRLIVYNRNYQWSQDKTLIIIANNPNKEFNCSSCFECNAFAKLEGAKIKLIRDIYQQRNCIHITENNITLDCASHSITGMYDDGVYFYMSSDSTIKNCFVSNFSQGIVIIGGERNKVTNNTVSDFYYGIEFSHSKNNQLQYNKFIPVRSPLRSLYVEGSSVEEVNQSIDTSNTISNKPIYYFFNRQNEIIENLDAGGIYLYLSSNVTLRNNELNTPKSDGINLYKTDNSTLINNHLQNIAWTSILVEYSKLIYVLNNTLNNENSIPIYFWSTSNSFISKNFIDNAWWGLNVDLGENNTAINNTISNVDYGIEAEATKNFKVIGNNVSNSYYGVVKFRGEIEIASDLITDNILHNNHYGIYIEAYNPNITIQHNTIMNSSVLSVYSQTSTELSYNRQGNYWSRSEYPYFCEYGNQNASCIDNWDSNRPDVIDSCPYNQSYPPGQWPASPRCPTPPVTNQCQSKGGICIDKCPEGYRQVDLSCGQTTTKTTGLFDGLLNFLGRFFLIAPQPAETTTQQTTQPAETPQTTPTTPVVIQPAATTSQPVKPATQTESQIPVTTQTVCCMKI